MSSEAIGFLFFPIRRMPEARDAFPEAGIPEIGGAGYWGWIHLDALDALVIEEAEDRVQRLASAIEETCLVIRSDLAQWWTFAVFPADRAPVRAWIHHGGPSGLSKADAKLSTKTLVERRELAGPASYRTPPALIKKQDKAKGNPGLKALRKLQASRICDALKGLDLPFDPRDLRPITAAAMGEFSVEEVLDEVLDVISAGKARVGLEDDPDWNVGDVRDAVSSGGRDDALYKLAPKALPIPGGPVALPATDLGLLWQIPWACQTDTEVDFLIRPTEGRLFLPPPFENWSPTHIRDGQTYIEVPWAPPGYRHRFFRQMGDVLARFPAGTQIEMISGVAEEAPHQAGRQRYLATLDGRGQVLISHASIPLRPADLTEAMKIVRTTIATQPEFELPTEEDARAVREASAKTDWFATKAELPKVRGRVVTPAGPEQTLFTALMVFRQRFLKGPWNTRDEQENEEDSHEEWEDRIEQVGKAMGQTFAAPAGGDVVFEGKAATFRLANWDDLTSGMTDSLEEILEGLDDEDRDAFQTPGTHLAPVDEALRTIGFELLGEVHCDKFPDLYLRAYALEEQEVYANVIGGTLNQFAYEFVTHFRGGGALTTSTTPGLVDNPKLKLFKRSHPTQKVEALWKSHGKHLKKLVSQGHQPKPIDATLAGFCRAVDEYLQQI